MKHFASLVFLCLLALPVSADRYDDLMASWQDNGNGGYMESDAMKLAWIGRARVQGLIEAYEVAGDVTRMAKAHTAVDYWVNNHQTNRMGEPAFLCMSVVANPGTEVHGEEFHILITIAKFIRAVKNNPELSQYSADADTYLAWLEDEMVPKWEQWIVDDSRQAVTGYHYPGTVTVTQPTCSTCTTDPYTYYLQAAQHNKRAVFGEFGFVMYDITGTQKYFNWGKGAALELKSKLMWNQGPTGWYYSWNYWDPSWDKDFTGMDGTGPTRFGQWIEHKDGYNALSVHLAVEAYLRGVVFCWEDIQRFVRGNRDIMWDGVTRQIDHGTWKLNDGSGATPTAYGGLNRAIAAFDTTGALTDFLYDFYDTVSSSWNTLKAPEFVHSAKAVRPPDTMHWVGPLEVVAVETVNINTIRLTFFNEVDSTTLDPEDFDFSRDIVATSVAIDPVDKRIVTVTSTDLAPGRTIKVTISNVQDIYGNYTFPNVWGGNQPVAFVASGAPAAVNDQLPRMENLRTGRLVLNANPVSSGTAVRLVNTGAERIVTEPSGAVVYRAGKECEARWNTAGMSGMYWIMSAGLVQKLVVLP